MKRKAIAYLFLLSLLLTQSCQEKVINVVDNTFEFTAQFSQPTFNTGDILSVDIRSNRQSVSVVRVSCSDEFTFDKLAAGISLYTNGTLTTIKSKESVAVDFEQIFTMVIEVQDTENTNEFKKVELSCSLAPAPPDEVIKPTKFIFSTTDLEKSIDRNTPSSAIHSVKFSIEPLGCTADFYIRCPDERVVAVADQDLLKQLTEDDLAGKMMAYTYDASSKYSPAIYFRAGNKPGDAVLTVGSVYNPLLTQDILVHVKEDVILIVSTRNIHQDFYSLKGGYLGRAYGYAGCIREPLCVKLCKFECSQTITSGDRKGETKTSTTEIDTDQLKSNFNQLHTFTPDINSGEVKVTFYIDAEQMTSHFMRGDWHEWGYKDKDVSSGSIHIHFAGSEWDAHSVTGPSTVNKTSGKYEETVTFEPASPSGASLPGLTYQVNYCNDVVAIDSNFNGSDNWHATQWKKFDIWHKDIQYDNKRYNLRYIIYEYKATNTQEVYMGGGLPWWLNSFDYEGRHNSAPVSNDWCISYNE